MITTKLGLQLLSVLNNTGDQQKAILQFKGIKNVEHLSRTELQEITELSDAFNKAVLTPKDVKDVSIEFTLGDHMVTLGKFSDLDITIQALELMEAFNPSETERVPTMLGCIYAPIIQEMFGFKDHVSKIAVDVTEAIKEQVSFEDVFAVYDFFVVWKGIFMRVPSPSFMHSMKCYRYQRRVQKPMALIIHRSLTHSRPNSNKITRGLRNLIFIANISLAIATRLFFTTIECLQKWYQTKLNR